MAALSAQRIAVSGTAPTYAAASAGGDTAPIGGGLLLHVVNGGGSSITLTVDTPGTVDGLAIGNASVAIPAGDSAFVPLTYVYRQSTGVANVTYSAVTSVEVAVIQHP